MRDERAMSIHPNHQQIIDALTADPSRLIKWAATEMVTLGSKSEWSMEDNFACTEGLAGLSVPYGLPTSGNQDDEALEFYGRAAHHIGFPSDWEDMRDDDED